MPAAANARLAQTEKLARAAIARYLPAGWRFGWVEDSSHQGDRLRKAARGRGPRVLGTCRTEERQICVSRAYALAGEPREIWETILHEIAHGLAHEAGHGAHGAVWVHFCHVLGIGAHGEAYSARMASEEGRA